jgi:hypothetical protein
MPISRRLRQLIKRLEILEEHFLPSPFSLTGNYTRKQKDHTRAYLVFAHAELEAYFEDAARERAELANKRWAQSSRCTPVLSRLLFFHHAASGKDQVGPLSSQGVAKALNYYSRELDQNHGIKEKHLLTMFLPLGFSHADLDSQLIAACNQLSAKRGQFAHTSVKTHQQIDPKTERDNIWNHIVPQLKKFDAKVKKL